MPAELLLAFGIAVWSLNFTAMKIALRHGWEPLALVPVRFGVAALALALIAWRREGSLAVRGRRDLGLVALATAVGIWGNQLMFIYAIRLAPASTVALCFGLMPIFVGVFSWLALHERLGRRHWLATAISFAGAALVALGAEGGVSGHLGGILLAIATVASFAVYSLLAVPLMTTYSPLRVSAVTTALGAVLIGASTSPVLARQDWQGIDALGWGAVAYASLASLVIGNTLWFVAVDRVGAARSSLFANLQPFLGALFAVLIISETLGSLQLAGGVVIAAGIVLARRRARPLPAD